MNHRDTHCRTPAREGYTLLELMIALAMLSVLVTLVWGLLSTFSSAEHRAARAADRLQLLRGIRQLLEQDLQQIDPIAGTNGASARKAGEPLIDSIGSSGIAPIASSATDLNRAPNQGRLLESLQTKTSTVAVSRSKSSDSFTGNAQGFSCRIRLDSNPTTWLETLVMDSSSDWESEPPALVSAAEANVTYHLETENWGEVQVAFLTRLVEVDVLASPQSSTPNAIDPDQVLDVSDLYRTSDEPMTSESDASTSRLRFGPLQGARFRYCDGQKWSASWNAGAQGSAPVAVELSFDLPPANLEPPASDLELLSTEDRMAQLELETTAERDALASETLLEGADLYGEGFAEESREFRIVVLVQRGERRAGAGETGALP